MFCMYEIDKNIFSDDNECTNDDHSCEHNCQNNDGSYTCSCDIEYSLTSNEKSCSGKK